jgi:ABC-type transporter Mla maintaining outer membrane lipid asymmetry ATPase subunit MlaF
MPAAAPSPPRRAEEPAGPLLRVDSVHVGFGRQEVLRDISLDLEEGRTLVVLGESGCGKTVLLKTMIGLIRPTAGNVLFAGRSLAGLSDRALAHLRTRYGFVFQGAALFDSFTIADNIAFPLREHTRLPEAEVRSMVESLVDEVGLPRSVLAGLDATGGTNLPALLGTLLRRPWEVAALLRLALHFGSALRALRAAAVLLAPPSTSTRRS